MTSLSQYIVLVLVLLTSYVIHNATSSPTEHRSKRMINGHEDVHNTVKHAARIEIDMSGEGAYECSGAIIGDRYILTAAHCFVEKGTGFLKDLPATAQVGANSNTTVKITQHHIEKIFVYGDYKAVDAPYNYGDIAVIKIFGKLDFTDERLEKLELPKVDKTYENVEGIFAGFGDHISPVYDDKMKVYRRAQTTRPILHWEQAATFPNNRCIKNSHIGRAFNATTQMCAYLTGQSDDNYKYAKGVCFGDSGGALVFNGTVIGIASHTAVDCNERTPARTNAHDEDTILYQSPDDESQIFEINPSVYTRVSAYLDFINNVMAESPEFPADARIIDRTQDKSKEDNLQRLVLKRQKEKAALFKRNKANVK